MVSVDAPAGLRDRRRAETVAEIKEAALRQLAEGGAEALSLRAVAREVGVSVQALYHYFDSRDALLTALIADTFTELADAVARASQAVPAPGRERVVAAGLAYRAWAVAHRSRFLLALGSALPDYSAPQGGPTTAGAIAMGRAFQEAVFGDWDPAELAAVPLPRGASPLLPAGGPGGPEEPPPSAMPAGALAQFVAGWASVHGVVVLELLGHLDWTGSPGEELCRTVLLRYADQLEAHRA